MIANGRRLLVFSFIISLNCCVTKTSVPDVFVIDHNLSSIVTFDLTKGYSVKIGTMTFLNTENKRKKWRYKYHAPLACLYDKIKKTCDTQAGMTLVSHNPDPEEADSVFWALLDSATFYTPVKPNSSTKITVFLNLNFYVQPKKLKQNLIKNHKNWEYHIFFRSGDLLYPDISGPPDFIIRSIKVNLTS